MDTRRQTWWCNIHSSFTICLLTQALFSGPTVLRLCVNPSFTSISGSNKERNCWRVSWTCKRCNCWAETQNHTVTTKNPSLTKIHPTCGSAMETISLASWESGVSQLPLPCNTNVVWLWGHMHLRGSAHPFHLESSNLGESIQSHVKNTKRPPPKNSNKGDFGGLFMEYWGLAHLIWGTAWMR